MGVIRRYRTALQRHHRSAGFGIHSPHAYYFVTHVLRGRLPYYAYEDIASLRQAVINDSSSHWPHPRIISLKNAKLLFRIVNNFNPHQILQIGTCYGVSTASMLAVDSRSRITLYEPHVDRYHPTQEVLRLLGERVERFDILDAAIASYQKTHGDDNPFVLVNNLPNGNEDYEQISHTLKEFLKSKSVIIMRNLSRDEHIKQLWNDCRDSMIHGQTFTNEKIAVLVASPKLQREDFFLWF